MNIVGVIRAAAGHHEPSTKKAAHQASTAHSKASETVSTTTFSIGYKVSCSFFTFRQGPPSFVLTSRTSFQKGDTVEYRPIGGAADTVSHSTGTITDIVEEDGVSDILLSLLIAASSHTHPALFNTHTCP